MIRATQKKTDDAAVHAFCLIVRARQPDGARKEKRRVEFNSEGARVYQWYQEKMG